MSAPDLAQVFRDLQSGAAARALENARQLLKADPRNARARMAEGIALRMLGQLDEARIALETARSIAPAEHGAAYELGLVLEMQGDDQGALALFERAATLRPGFFAARFAAGMQHLRTGAWTSAVECFQAVTGAQPGFAEAHAMLVDALIGSKQVRAARDALGAARSIHPADPELVKRAARIAALEGDFAAAANLFATAARDAPHDTEPPMFLAQMLLALGRWREGWAAYSHREHRRRFEAARRKHGDVYQVPAIDELRDRTVTLVGEQGLGDVLFFLRFAPRLRDAGARLAFAGDARLLPLLGRTSIFESLRASSTLEESGEPGRVLVGDLPAIGDPAAVPPPLGIAPDSDRFADWERRLETLGPRPWTAVTWRAGTPAAVLARGLFKTLPVHDLFSALRPRGGTLLALQRGLGKDELDEASSAFGRIVHDLSAAAEDLEDCLALAALVDRHVAVSSTNMHLAAAAGASADVLVPFPPEWRWGIEGGSPWFPGFRVHRQSRDLDWTDALAALSR